MIDNLPAGWSITRPFDINDLGQVVGSATFDPDGPTGAVEPVTHAFLLTPVPEPSSGLMLVAGLAAVATRRRRRRRAG